MTLGFTADVKNDVTLCKLDIYVKNRTAVAGSVDFFQFEKKLFNGNMLLYSKFLFLKIKCGESKGMQEKVSIMSVWCR